MGDIIPDEGWVIQDDPDELPESVTKPRTPAVEEEETYRNVPLSLWRKYGSSTRNLETLGDLPRGFCERIGLGDPWPEFHEREAKKKKKV